MYGSVRTKRWNSFAWPDWTSAGDSVVEKVTRIETRLQSDNEGGGFPFFPKSDDISKKSFTFAAKLF